MLDRRQLLSNAALGSVFGGKDLAQISDAGSFRKTGASSSPVFDVRTFGATGDGKTTDSPAINRAIEAAASRSGGTVYFPAGTCICYSLRLKSFVCLYPDQGATILAASTPMEGTITGGYDSAEPQGVCEPYQDYGHNHWHSSLLWGEGIHD